MPQFLRFAGCVFLFSVLATSAQHNLSAAEPNSAPSENSSGRVVVRARELREFDWAKIQARARVAYISSGPRTQSARMIDNDLQTSFRFSASDRSPTVILELAQTAPLHRVTAVFKAEDARVDIYLLNELPKDPRDLRSLTPTATIVDPPQDQGIATVTFSASSARYVALRWIRKKSDEPFQVAEISAFSNEPTDFAFDQIASDSGPKFVTTEPPIIPLVSP